MLRMFPVHRIKFTKLTPKLGTPFKKLENLQNVTELFENSSYPFVIPYLFSDDPVALVDLMTNAFSAEEARERTIADDGTIQNALLRIGNSYFEISQARGEFKQITHSFHLYCEDVESLHKQAINAGCTEKYSPSKQDYGDLESWIIDPFGNNWFLATHLE